MLISTSSVISEWITAALIEKIIGSKFLTTSFSKVEDLLVDFVSDVKLDGQVRVGDQPKLWFVNTDKVDWEAARKNIFSSLSWNKLQVGEPTELEFIIEDLIAETSVKDTADLIYKLFLENSSDILLNCTIMHALSHIEYEVIYPYGPMMAMTMLSHDDKRVVSFAIKAFSNWNSKDSLKYVKNLSPKQEWAKKEWNRVVDYIEKNGDERDGIFDEKNRFVKVDSRTA